MVEPVFFLKRDLPPGVEGQLGTLDICLSAERVSGPESVTGAQEIRGLWRIYPSSRTARADLLVSGIEVHGHAITLHNKNPFILREDGTESPTTKVWISDIPISVCTADLESALARSGAKLRSSMMMEKARNRDGKLTRFLTGRRFVFITVPATPLEKTIKIGGFIARIYHREQPKGPTNPASLTCRNCFLTGHRSFACPNAIVCRACHVSGHREGDEACQVFATERASEASASVSGSDDSGDESENEETFEDPLSEAPPPQLPSQGLPQGLPPSSTPPPSPSPPTSQNPSSQTQNPPSLSPDPKKKSKKEKRKEKKRQELVERGRLVTKSRQSTLDFTPHPPRSTTPKRQRDNENSPESADPSNKHAKLNT